MSKWWVIGLIIGFCASDSIYSCEKYDRKNWKHWIDEDGDCQNTRQEVLIRDSIKPVKYVGTVDAEGCKVFTGYWYDPYTGKTFTNPKQLDVDHVVPLKEAFESGGYKWSKEKKREYANYLKDEFHIIPVYLGENRSKGAKDPAEWLPENLKFKKQYAKMWVRIKLHWNLSSDNEELAMLRRILGKHVQLPALAEEYTCK